MTDKLTIDRKDAIEAIALLDAASNVHIAMNGGADTLFSDFFTGPTWELKARMLGPNPEDDDEFEKDATVVHIYVRAYELAAEALASLGQPRQHRELARRMQEAGNVNVPSPFLEDGWDA